MEKIKQIFTAKFGSNNELYFAPGRINIIGEHTDYNEGFVFPAAIDLGIYFAISKNNTHQFNFIAADLNDECSFHKDDLQTTNNKWDIYLKGVIFQFIEKGFDISGFDCVFGGNLPHGSGMSSSAALECGLAYAINDLFSLRLSLKELAFMCQKAEHDFAGVKCGIMDQFAVCFGKSNNAILLDCQSLETKYIPFKNQDYCFALVNSGVKHSLASGEYNKRRNDCQKGVEVLNKQYANVNSLRQATSQMLNSSEIDESIYARCSYVIEENKRVLKSIEYLNISNFNNFGQLMFQSHEGLKNKYEVSCTELDFLVDLAKKSAIVSGSRLMGGGFGGCTINLLKETDFEQFTDLINRNYKTPSGQKPEIYKVKLSNGVRKIQ